MSLQQAVLLQHGDGAWRQDEDAVQARGADEPTFPLGHVRDHQAPLEASSAAVGTDEDAEAAGVPDLQLGEVEVEVPAAGLDLGMEGGADPRGAVRVQSPDQAHLGSGVHHGDVDPVHDDPFRSPHRGAAMVTVGTDAITDRHNMHVTCRKASPMGRPSPPPAWSRRAGGGILSLVSSWGSFSYAFGPLVALGGLLVIVGMLRWAFGRGRSLVERRPVPGGQEEYGLLVVAAALPTVVEAEVQRRRLVAVGIRATVATTLEGPRVMVFPEDLRTARAILRS